MGREERQTKVAAATPERLEERGQMEVALGAAGLPEFTTIVYHRDGVADVPGGTPGQYSAVVTLSRPGIRPLREYAMSPSQGFQGDSHVRLAPPGAAPTGDVSKPTIGMQDGGNPIFGGFPNEEGFLSQIAVYPFPANSFIEAYDTAYRLVAPSLSGWSAHLDVPLHVFQVDVVELATGNMMIGYVNPFQELPWSALPRGRNRDKDLEALVSVYREALNSNSLLYQYLCFHKIVGALHGRRRRLAKEGGGVPVPVNEAVPHQPEDFEPWLSAVFPVEVPKNEPYRTMYFEAYLPAEARGRTFEDLLGLDAKTPGVVTDVRNKIAHALWSPRSPSE